MNVPEGASPDNQECMFKPGSVGSRPGFQKVFADAVGTVTFTYGKSYVDPLKVVRNLYLASDGTLYLEDVPPTPIGTTTPGTYAKSVTAFGREYIAISDGLHGQEVPLQYDGTFLDRVTQDGPGATPDIVSVALPPTNMALVPDFYQRRMNNLVTTNTATPHGLKVGYRAQIYGVAPAPIAVIDTLVIDNDNNPGVATITITPAGSPPATDIQFAPGEFVIIISPTAQSVATLTSVTRAGGIVTFQTAAPHLLQAGASIIISGTSNATLDGVVFTVASVTGTQTFTALQAAGDLVYSGTGDVAINWPFASQQFEVVSAPGPNIFQIRISYSNGTWTTGEVHFPWDGTFYVSSVPTPTSFTYQQYGPDEFNVDSPGTVTPKGQAAPGKHQMQLLYLTRQGYVTKPSPPVKFVANGDQYLDVSNIPLGPPNIVARILAFTGADGSEFFYIPVPAQVNGQVVSTATQINDNTTTSVRLDFGDPTLFAGLDIGTIGNDLPSQMILDSVLGFGFYGSRLIAYGMRNIIQNLLGMSFDSGAFPTTPTIPTGWTPSGSGAGGALAAGHYGRGWQFSGGGSISQSFYLDAYGAPIASPNRTYTFRAWLSGVGATATLTIASAATGFSTSATITGVSANGSWIEADFNLPMPAVIPVDMRLTLSGSAGLLDEMSIIFKENPFLDKILVGSYVDNPEGFDGISGRFGPVEDTHKIMDIAVIRGTLYMLTRDPAGRLHSTVNNGTTEPAGWTVTEVGTMCGALSAFGSAVSQADDATGAGGEQWWAWASQTGARIFGGDQPWKISQEIQIPGVNQPGWSSIIPAAATTIWALNDNVERRIYFGLPVGQIGSPAVDASAPTVIYHVDYKDLDTAYEIAQASPYRSGGRGLQAPYTTRKWNPWHRPMNAAAIMVRGDGVQLPTFMGGNGQAPNTAPGFGNVYLLASQCSDDDYGQFFPTYTTYFFANHELEAILGIGGQRKLLQFYSYVAQIPAGSPTTTGYLKTTVYQNNLTNPWPIAFFRNLSHEQSFDIETPGGNPEAQRFAIKFEWFPGTA